MASQILGDILLRRSLPILVVFDDHDEHGGCLRGAAAKWEQAAKQQAACQEDERSGEVVVVNGKSGQVGCGGGRVAPEYGVAGGSRRFRCDLRSCHPVMVWLPKASNRELFARRII